MNPQRCDAANTIEGVNTPPKLKLKNLEHHINYEMNLNKIGMVISHIMEIIFEEFMNCNPFYYYKNMLFFKTIQRVFKTYIKETFGNDYHEWCNHTLSEAFDKYLSLHNYINHYKNENTPRGHYEETIISISLFKDLKTCFDCETCKCEIDVHYNSFDSDNYIDPWSGKSNILKLECPNCYKESPDWNKTNDIISREISQKLIIVLFGLF